MRSTKIAPEALSTSYLTGSASLGISMMTLISSGGFLPVGTRSRPIAIAPTCWAAAGRAAVGGRGGRAFYPLPEWGAGTQSACIGCERAACYVRKPRQWRICHGPVRSARPAGSQARQGSGTRGTVGGGAAPRAGGTGDAYLVRVPAGAFDLRHLRYLRGRGRAPGPSRGRDRQGAHGQCRSPARDRPPDRPDRRAGVEVGVGQGSPGTSRQKNGGPEAAVLSCDLAVPHPFPSPVHGRGGVIVARRATTLLREAAPAAAPRY